MSKTSPKYYQIDGVDYNDVFMLSVALAEKPRLSINQEKVRTELSAIKRLINYLFNGIKNKVITIKSDLIETGISFLNPSLHKTDFILFATEPTEVKQLEVLEKKIQESGKTVLFTTDRINIWRILRNKNIKTYFLRKNRKYFHKIARIANQQAEASGTESRVKINYMQEHLALYLSLATKLKELLKSTSPNHIFVGYDLTQEGRLFSLIAKKNNIKSYCIQHGMLYKDTIHSKHIVDRFFAYGETSVNILKESGLNSKKIFVTGAPYLEGHNKSFQKNSKSKGHIPCFLICLSGVGHSTTLDHHVKIIECLKKGVQNFPDAEFIIKLHRKDSMEYYKDLFKMQNVKVIDSKNKKLPQDVFDYLINCDALITGSSSTATEAMYLNIPVISVDLCGEYQDIDFIKQKVTFHAETCNSFIDNLKIVTDIKSEMLSTKIASASKYVEKYFSRQINNPSISILSNLN